MSEKGWICLHRKIMDNEIWLSDEPYDRRSAMSELFMLANHTTKTKLFDGNPIVIERGQFITSQRKLAERWHWSNTKVKKFLDTLQALGTIEYFSDTKKTVINVVNYEVYQHYNLSENDTETSQEHIKSDTETYQKNLTNNVNHLNTVNTENTVNKVNNEERGKEGAGRETTSEISKSDCAISPEEPTAKDDESSDEKHEGNVIELKKDDFVTSESGVTRLSDKTFEMVRKRTKAKVRG